MNKKKIVLADIAEKSGLFIVCFMSAAIAFWLTAASMLHTATVANVSESEAVASSLRYFIQNIESVLYYDDNFFMNIIILLISAAALYFVSKKLSWIRLRYKLLFIFIWTAALGTIWVISSQSSPTFDSEMLFNSAKQFANNDYSILTGTERYFKDYSFQLGYVFFCEILMRIFGIPEKALPFEVLNAFFLAGINVLIVLISNITLKDKRITTAVTLLLALSCAPIISCSFVYGILPGMFFALASLFFELRYLMDNKKISAVLSVICILIAVMIKSNYFIWLIAISLIAIVMLFKRKKYIFDCIYISAAVILSLSVQPCVKYMYESRSNTDLGDAIPYTSWIAMGFSEAASAPGWYNYYLTTTNFENCGYDAAKAGEASRETIKERLKTFIKDPQYANDFFYKKTMSQWNETSYESIWNNTIRGQYKDKNRFAAWVCGDGVKKTKKYIDLWTQLMFASFTAGIIAIFRKKNFPACSLAVVFLGGFLYQLISEGKSQYIIPYIIVMTGIAGYGVIVIGGMLGSAFRKYRSKKAEAAVSAADVESTAAEEIKPAEKEADTKPQKSKKSEKKHKKK